MGNRTSGKYCRVYQTGKQLGYTSSQWTRIEIEWRVQDREMPYNILTSPTQYLAESMPLSSRTI